MHETMVRLYQAAKELKGIDGRGAQSEIARLLDASPQQIKNWEGRGISNKGMIAASKMLGISVSWLETGQGEMRETYQLPTKGDVRDIHEPRLWSSNTPLPEDEYTFAPYKKEVEFTGGAGRGRMKSPTTMVSACHSASPRCGENPSCPRMFSAARSTATAWSRALLKMPRLRSILG